MKIKLSTIIRFSALILVILFFIPTSIASCSSYGTTASVDISPFNLATGNLKMETNDPDETADEAEKIEDIEAQPVLFAMLALSVAVVALGSKVPILGAILSVGNAVVLFVMHLKIAEYIATEYDGWPVKLTKTTAYYIYIFIAAIIAVLLLLDQFGILGKMKAAIPNIKHAPPHDRVIRDSSEILPADRVDKGVPLNGKKCEKCGCVCGDNEMFCGNCGEKLTDSVPSDIPQAITSDTVSSINTNAYKVKQICGHCGFVCEDGEMFCSNCGEKLNGQTTDKSAPTIKSETLKVPVTKTNSESKPNSAFHAPDDLN